jgi:hypothetical protein
MKILAINVLKNNPFACLSAALRAVALPGMLSLLMACTSRPATAPATPATPTAAVTKPLDFYRCEYGIEFTAKFVDNSVTLDSSRGYDVLFKDSKASASPVSPSVTPVEYSNPRMNATFNLGVTGREAVLRYPLLPLVSRCVRE